MASSSAPKVPVYSVNDLKSTTDDALVPYLCNLPQPYTFTQDHSKSNVRFILGYSAVAIAAFTFYADRKLGWEATTSPWIIAAVFSYFVLNSVLTYWVWAVEAGEVFRGKRKSGETISIQSFAKKHSPLYKLRIVYTSPSNKVLQEKEIETPFTKWFSAEGFFHPEPLRSWLATEVEVLRLAAKETERKTGGVGSVVGVQDSKNRK
ncbi:signal peptidase complex subunit 2 [Aspergillus clavatus NRRL 1]|uniref:Signal peptidase complex subunit 2 n=1 Tax=Aspergillus clavatus (strain ATCC 1007 / CBS 513.65 / DSM 816 / NCTC 3887 / NRRL 1 / QM 1276 / 107) TaxID=344612 RepID=A1C475_ASPCL|nr:signal peptidase complex component, putative [Aspergillus clavatus NRRL 1]EAW15215.1 signal peptidase complex component, putative [Aspergillus clavatus NRRL 1]